MADLDTLLDEFLQHTESEDPKVSKAFSNLAKSARPTLGQLLSRFDYTHTGALDENERALARRVLGLVQRPSAKGLELLLEALDMLDVNEDQMIDHPELTLAVEIFEMFCKADSVNNTLSTREIEMLLVVLKSMDSAGTGVLDEAARTTLRDSLWDPDAYLEEQKANNPALKALIES